MKKHSIAIVGSGTAGLLSGLMLRQAFPTSEITIISSSKIGIIGVGEGSTEHWRGFMEQCQIPLEEMLSETSATHKYGIRFENWTTHTPDYFHSISHVDDSYAHGYIPTYLGCFERKKLLTNQTSSVGLTQNKINRLNLHKTTNQYHFDTFKLNTYLSDLCFKRMIRFVEGEVADIEKDSNTNDILSVITNRQEKVIADFWIDASGFNRVLMTSLGNDKWNSFSDYLLCDSAIAFPTESDPNGQIRPYTRAIAASAGWLWEIPTQERRGNGYVFSSKFISLDQAIAEASAITGYNVESARNFSFDPGYLDKQFVNNCIAVGLSSSFVEPLEATSIGSTISQLKYSIQYIASYAPQNNQSRKKYNELISNMMDNILSMIRLHYISDRLDTPFWKEQSRMKINDSLQDLIDLWNERPPSRWDIPTEDGRMFLVPHMCHVMQGQGLIPSDPSSMVINNLNIRQSINYKLDELNNSRHNHELVDHKQALQETAEMYFS